MHGPLFIRNAYVEKVMHVVCCVNVLKGRVLYLETDVCKGNRNDLFI